MGSNNMQLVFEACRALRLNNRTLGEYLGLSRRTIQRYVLRGTFSSGPHLRKLAAGVYPVNPELATKLAAAGGTTIEALDLNVAGPRGAAPAFLVRPEHVDSVVCAAADALKLHPAAVRPAIAAALGRMLELHLSAAALKTALAPPSRAKPSDG